MSSFKRFWSKDKYIFNIFFCPCQYARISRKIQYIENIQFVDKKKLVGNTFKTQRLRHPFNVKRNNVQFFQKGNNFENISSGRNLFFSAHFCKMTNMPIAWIFCPKEKGNRYIVFGGGNLTCPNQSRKKSHMIRFPKMHSKKLQKKTMLHIWWLVVKKSCC